MILSTTHPRHTFLTRTEVMARYRWKRTKGYQLIGSPSFPRDIAGMYRLDTLLAWEDSQLGDEPQPCTIATSESDRTVQPVIELIEPHARHTFLSRTEVMARYRWKRTKGYRLIATDQFPSEIAGRFRLDSLMAWEDGELARPQADSSPHAVVAVSSEAPMLPTRRRTRGPAGKAAV